MDEFDELMVLRQQGFFCSQILMLKGLEMLGKENPDLVRAMNGLAGGLGFSGELCGALSGGAALLGLYAGRGTPEDEPDPHLDFMILDLVEWFKKEFGEKYGGINCMDMLSGDRKNQSAICPVLVSAVLQKSKELLVENGFDLSGLE